MYLHEIALCDTQSYVRVGSGGSGRGNPDAASTASGVAPVGGSRVRGRGDPVAARDSDPNTIGTRSVIRFPVMVRFPVGFELALHQ